MDRGEGREIQFQSPVSLVTLIAMNRLENITYGGGKETTARERAALNCVTWPDLLPFNSRVPYFPFKGCVYLFMHLI